MILNKEEIKERINEIPKNDDFYLDKLYFLMGLKKVVRVRKKGRDASLVIKGLEGINNVSYDDDLFFAFNLEDAKNARDLTLSLMERDLNDADKMDKEIKLGRLYGYPECCSRHFCENIDSDIPNKRFEHNGVSLVVLHYPCKDDCIETNKIIETIKLKMDELGIRK